MPFLIEGGENGQPVTPGGVTDVPAGSSGFLIDRGTPKVNTDVMHSVVKESPEKETRVRDLSRDTGLEEDTVRSAPEEAEAVNRVNQIDQETSDTPVTRRFIANPNNAAVAHDDVESLSAIERLVNAFNTGRDEVALNRAGSDLRADPNNPAIQAAVDKFRARIAKRGTDTGDDWVNYLTSAAKVIGQQAEIFAEPQAVVRIAGGAGIGATLGAAGGPLAPATIPAGFAAGTLAGVTGHFAISAYEVEGGGAYLEMTEKGIPKEEAAYLSHAVGVINATLEVGSAAVILKPFKDAGKNIFKKAVREALSSDEARNVAARFVAQTGSGIAAEVTTEILQEVVQIVGEEFGKSFKEGETEEFNQEEAIARIKEVSIETLKAMSVLAPIGPGFNAVTTGMVKASKAVAAEQRMLDIHEAVKASTINDRAPDILNEHLESVFNENDITEVFVPAEALSDWVQRTENPQQTLDQLGVGEQLQEELVLGGDVTIGVKEIGSLMQNENFPSLANNIRMTEEGFTGAEAQEFAASGIQDEVLRVEVEQPVAQHNEDVDFAEHELGLKALFTTADEAGLNPKKFEAYLDTVQKASEKAAAGHVERSFRRQKRAIEGQFKTREKELVAEATDTLSKQPVYASVKALEGNAARLPREDLQKILKGLKSDLQALPKNGNKAIYETKKDGETQNLELFAEIHGYDNATEMVEDMITSPPLKEAVQSSVREQLQKEFPDIDDRIASLEAARAVSLNEIKGEQIQQELNILREQQGLGRLSQKVIKTAAKKRLATVPVGDIKVNKFLANMKRLGPQVGKAVRANDRQLAAQLKFQQVINFQMAKESQAIQDKVVRQKNFMSKFLVDDKKTKSVDIDYINAIRDLLDGFNFQPRLSQKSFDRIEKIINHEIDPVTRDEKLMERFGTTSMDSLTLEQHTEIAEMVKEMAKKGADVFKLREGAKQASVKLSVANVTRQIFNNLKPKTSAAKADASKWETWKAQGRAAASIAFTMDSIMKNMDGQADLGPAQQEVKGRIDKANFQGYKEGQVGYTRRQLQVAKDLKAINEKHFTTKERNALKDRIAIPGIDEKMTKDRMLGVMLNLGNQGNIDALIESGTVTQAEIDAIKDFASERDWQYVQDTWDYLDSFFPEIRKTVRERTNNEVAKVEAQQVDTKFGTFKGGYFPIRYDNKQALADVYNQQDIDELIMNVRRGEFAMSHTARGHTKARTNPGAGHVALGTHVINSHLDNVIYDLEMGDAVNDVYKIWFHEDVRNALTDQGYKHYWEYGDLWLRDVISQEIVHNDAVSRVIKHLRTGFTVSKLGWNFGVAAVQFLGLVQSSVQVGHTNMAHGIRAFMGAKQFGEGNIYDFIAEQSGFMASREDSFNKDIMDARNAFSNSVINKFLPKNVGDVTRASLFLFIRKAQKMVDTITWLAGYHKGMQLFDNQEKAVELADRTVSRSQGSGVFQERSAFERGTISRSARQNELVRSFSTLSSYFIAKTNVASEKFRSTDFKDPKSLSKLIADMALLYWFEAMVAATVSGQLPDDESELPGWMLQETLATGLGGIPFIRTGASALKGFESQGALAAVLGEPFEVVGAILEDDFSLLRDGKKLNNFFGALFKYPSGFINKQATNIDDALSGNDPTPLEWVLGPTYEK